MIFPIETRGSGYVRLLARALFAVRKFPSDDPRRYNSVGIGVWAGIGCGVDGLDIAKGIPLQERRHVESRGADTVIRDTGSTNGSRQSDIRPTGQLKRCSVA
jgi:hypothetical protein